MGREMTDGEMTDGEMTDGEMTDAPHIRFEKQKQHVLERVSKWRSLMYLINKFDTYVAYVQGSEDFRKRFDAGVEQENITFLQKLLLDKEESDWLSLKNVRLRAMRQGIRHVYGKTKEELIKELHEEDRKNQETGNADSDNATDAG